MSKDTVNWKTVVNKMRDDFYPKGTTINWEKVARNPFTPEMFNKEKQMDREDRARLMDVLGHMEQVLRQVLAQQEQSTQVLRDIKGEMKKMIEEMKNAKSK